LAFFVAVAVVLKVKILTRAFNLFPQRKKTRSPRVNTLKRVKRAPSVASLDHDLATKGEKQQTPNAND
jgi:hypothetical protein